MPIIGDRPKSTKKQLRELKWFLRQALVNYESRDHLQMHESRPAHREYDLTGLKLRDRFVSYLEVLWAFCQLAQYDQAMIYENLCLGYSQDKIADRLAIHRNTVQNHMRGAYEEMISLIWQK